jgi:cyanate permease
LTGAGLCDLRSFVDLARARPVQLVLAMSVGVFFFNHGLTSWLPEILRTGGMDATASGYWASVPTVIGVAGALAVPRLAGPHRRRGLLFVLFVAAATATLTLESSPGPVLALALVLQGIARGSMMAVILLVLMDLRDVGAERMGAAGGLLFSTSEIGGVLGPLAVGALYDSTGRFTAGLALMTGVCGALMVVLWLFHRTTGHRRPARYA